MRVLVLLAHDIHQARQLSLPIMQRNVNAIIMCGPTRVPSRVTKFSNLCLLFYLYIMYFITSLTPQRIITFLKMEEFLILCKFTEQNTTMFWNRGMYNYSLNETVKFTSYSETPHNPRTWILKSLLNRLDSNQASKIRESRYPKEGTTLIGTEIYFQYSSQKCPINDFCLVIEEPMNSRNLRKLQANDLCTPWTVFSCLKMWRI